MNGLRSCFKSYRISSVLSVLMLVTVAWPIKAGVWTEPNRFDVNIIEGCSQTEILTIGNDGNEALDFIIRTRQVGGLGGSRETTRLSAAKLQEVLSVPQGYDFTVAGQTPYEPGKLIVRFAAKADGQLRSTADKNQILASLGGGRVIRSFNIVPGLSVVELPAGVTVEEALQSFNRANGILYAQPNYEVKAISTFPDDTRFNELWGMHNTGQSGGTEDADIDAPEAWDIGTGSREIVVAVIDTGVDYTHPDLAKNMWTNAAEANGVAGVDDDGNGYVDDIYGYDFRNNDGNPMDDHYHGTHCAGTIGGVGNNSEGVAGVCWKVKIMALKFLSSGGSGWTDDAIESVEYSVLMGANLSSNSWGGGGYSQGLKDAIDAAGAAGMLFVAAAGNDNENGDVQPHYPSSYDCESLISVMATDKYDNKSSFSNYGEVSVDLGAPGSSILSCEPGGGYQYLSGTSMATPHVAGACALLWSMNPAMSNDEVKDILLQTVDATLPGLCVSQGRLNLYNAILETKAPWIGIEPEAGTIGPGESSDVNVTFDAIELGPGVYEAEIVIISDEPCSPAVVPVTMTVSADALQVSPAEGFESSGTEGGPFEPECVVYTLTNITDAEPVYWRTWQTENWLCAEPNEGVLDPRDSIEVSVCISADANLLDPNIYTEILTFQNMDSNSIKLRQIALTVKPPDCFTESFGADGGDLEGLMLTFSPDGSRAYYEVCREKVDEFPTDPNGGWPVSLGDDDFAEVVMWLPWRKVLFYGERYNRFYIGSNGYITFGDGDTQFECSLENHFSMPRISGLFADLTPSDEQCVSYKKLSDRVVVTFQDVPVYGDKTATNSFQIEMFYVDGTIRITWLEVAPAAGIAGLSRGRGLPPAFFEESNLNKYPPCWPWCDFDKDYLVNFTDFAMFAMSWLEVDCEVPYWCSRADLDFSGAVETADVEMFAEDWLMKTDWFLQPVSHWKFDEGTGTIAYDSAGNNDGTIYGAQWTDGKIGDYALAFDGNGDYVSAGDVHQGGLTEYSMACWVKVNLDLDKDRSFLFGVQDESQSGRYTFACCLYENEADSRFLRCFAIKEDSSAFWETQVSKANIPDDEWFHLAMSWRSSSGEEDLKVYVNGQVPADTIYLHDSEGSLRSGGAFNVGRDDGDSSRDLRGLIDDVRIYDRALSAEEIWQLYQDGLSHKASDPYPIDGATGVDPNVVFSWSPGKDASSHDVYLGTDYGDVNDANTSSAEYMGNFDVNSFDPCGLELATTYFWRVDELDDSNTYKGDVWSFKTWVVPNLVGWWEFEEGSGTVAHDSSGSGNDGTLMDDPCWIAGKIGSYALDFDGMDDYVVVQHTESLAPTNQISFTLWAYSSDWTQYTSGMSVISKTQTGGYNLQGIEIPAGWAIQGVVRRNGEYARVSIPLGNLSVGWHCFSITYDARYTKLYVDGILQEVDDGGSEYPIQYAYNNSLIIGGEAGTGSIPESEMYFNGVIDDVRIYDRALSAGEVWQLYYEGLGPKAYAPCPADGATGVDPNVVLRWSPGKDALSHDVYLGTDYNDVNDANTSSAEYMGNFDVNSFDPCGLELETTYYWRIDEVDDSNTYKGDVWSFTTFDVNLGLVGWWEFEEGSGSIAYDSAGTNHGTLHGDTNWVTGRIGDYALDFDGDGDYVEIANDPSISLLSEGSMAAWFKTLSPFSGDTRLISKDAPGSNSGDSTIIFRSDQTVDFYIYGDADPMLESTTTIEPNAWYFIVVTWDGANKLMYMDGIQEPEISGNQNSALNSVSPLYIGSGGTSQFFNGQADDVRIYERALSAEEIWQLYQEGLVSIVSNPNRDDEGRVDRRKQLIRLIRGLLGPQAGEYIRKGRD